MEKIGIDLESVTAENADLPPATPGDSLRESPTEGVHQEEETWRQSERLRFTVIARLTSSGGSFEAYSTDLSTDGIFLETANLLSLGTPVRLDFRLFRTNEPEAVTVQGTVARSVSVDEAGAWGVVGGLGIHFEELRFGEEVLFGFLSKRLKSVKAPKAPIPSDKKRPAARADVGLPVLWGTDPNLGREGFLFNLSASGAFIGTRKVEPPGTHLFLWFELPHTAVSKGVKVTASVVRTNPPGGSQPAGMGIAFEASTVSRGLFEGFLGQRVEEKREPGESARFRRVAAKPPSPGPEQISTREDSRAPVRWKLIFLVAIMATSTGTALSVFLLLRALFP
jgi:Tfp pilus assembly protein PilZ